jgi:RNA polymerase sigma factor (TIGR02999 family)
MAEVVVTDNSTDGDLTVWLKRMSSGERQASEHVGALVYTELRRMAALAIRHENRYHSLQPSLLVSEVFMKLMKGRPIDWQDRSHFYSVAARMMRQIVVDYFRQSGAQKRPPRGLQIDARDAIVFTDERRDEALMVDEAIDMLKEVDARAASVVELRYFGGLTCDETAGVLNVNGRTVKRDWEMAQWWLRRYFDTGAAGCGIPQP